jgi:hypothetical protein
MVRIQVNRSTPCYVTPYTLAAGAANSWTPATHAAPKCSTIILIAAQCFGRHTFVMNATE